MSKKGKEKIQQRQSGSGAPIINKNDLQQAVLQVMRAEMFTGPLPHPTHLKEYEAILPGAAERIMKMAEEQGKHRREIEKTVILSESKNSARGSWFAFIFGMSSIIIGSILLLLGKDIQGFGAMITGMAPILIAFIVQSSKRRKERLQKYGKDVS